ncbi:unnamed protein product [Sphenostylis stenocarpa]|uniref:Uncharacterized protein n=1 Tax=Sphenostylis stenocarpa TaxID=92480 RepID=A0AA86S2T6_9FABA|nr:unnamed protein product [Sphenostylis stenocarpa]
MGGLNEQERIRQLVVNDKNPSLDVGPNGRPLFTSAPSFSHLSRNDARTYFKKRLVIRDFKTNDPYVVLKLGNQNEELNFTLKEPLGVLNLVSFKYLVCPFVLAFFNL